MTLAAATWALERGYAPVPIPRGTKGPRIPKWQELRFDSEEELAEHFTEEANIGLILGAASNGLVDVDLDCPEAVALAPHLLTQTNMQHGRASAPRSHYWYVVDREVALTQFKDPVVLAEQKERKRKGLPGDPDLKAMLVELRSTGGQTVIPPSIHPDTGERIAWTTDTPVPREVAAPELQLRVRIVAAASLLVRYWPPSGQRHDATLALAGGLLRSGWNEKNAAALVTAVGVAVDPGVDRADRTATVRSTAERLEADEETSGWRSLGDYTGRMVVDQVREWLDLTEDEEGEDEPSSTLEDTRVDLGALVRDGVPDPEWVLPGMFYRAQIHWWHGEPGDGKTFLLLGLMYRLCEQGMKVLWIDEESGKIQTARRLQSYGADPDVLTERFVYHARPGLTMDPADLDALFRLVATERPDVVVFDSVSDVLDQAGLDEDVNKEVTRWAKTFIEPLKFEYDCAVVAIDHVTKSKDSRGKYARGAGAKKSKTDAAWKVVKVKDFGVARVGLIRLEADKDRDGWLEPKLAFKIGGQGGRTLLEAVDAVETGGNKLPDGEVEQRIVEFLRLNADCEQDSQPTKEVEAAVTGKGTAIRDALKVLLDEPETGVRMVQRGTGHYWWWQDLSDSVELDFRSLEED